MLERFEVLEAARVAHGDTILEVGAGGHAIATVPLAYLAGRAGRVLAAERERWSRFREVVSASGLGPRVRPVACDARRLPVRDDGVDLAVCVHGVRSLGGRPGSVAAVREMLRVAPRVFLAESLPEGRTDAQAAHLQMYDLREEVFRRSSGVIDDTRYPTLDQLSSLAESAGAVVERAVVVEPDLPHYLARFSRELVERLPPGPERDRLLRQWDAADAALRQHGEDHPPVGTVLARRTGAGARSGPRRRRRAGTAVSSKEVRG